MSDRRWLLLSGSSSIECSEFLPRLFYTVLICVFACVGVSIDYEAAEST